MANNQPNWKNPGGGSRSSGNVSRKQWQPGATPKAAGPADPKARARKRLLAAGVTGSLLIALVVVVIWLWKPAKHPALVITAPDTSNTLSAPANVYGQNSIKELAAWSAGGKDRARVAGEAGASRDAWKANLGKAGEKAIVLYFAAPGASDANGPYLLMTPADAAGINLKDKLPVREILQGLAELPADKQKLLIFDAAFQPSSYAHGFLHNDFARGLKALDAEIEKIPNLVVIASADADQRSWVSEELRQPIFGHFVNQAVRGATAGKDPRVSAQVLFDYVKQNVGDWARANRDAEQTPVLLPTASGKDRAEKFEVASVQTAPTAVEPPGNSFSVPADLKAAWETSERLARRQPPPETANPSAWRSYLDTLLRWEHLVRAGASADAVSRQAAALERELEQNLFDTDPPCLANSLAIPAAFGIAMGELDEAVFRAIWSPLPGKKPEEVWKEHLAAVRSRDGERGITLARMQAGRKVFDLLAQNENSITPENLTRARDVLEIIDEGQPRPIELHYLLMLGRDLDGKQRPESVHILQALRLRYEAEQIAWLAGAKDGYSYPDQTYRWIERSLAAADRTRQYGEDLLLAVDKVSWAKSRKFLREAEEAYVACAKDARTAAAALRMRDRLQARLPYLGRWLAGYRGALPETEIERLLKLVERLAEQSHTLDEKLEAVPENAVARLGELETLTTELKAGDAELQRVLDEDTSRLSATALPSNWHAIDNALTLPFIPVDRRVKLLTDLRSISRQLNDKSQTQSSQTTASAFDAKALAQRNGRVALALLGERWVEDAEARGRAPRGSTLLHYGDLKQRINQPAVGNWQDSLRDAGEQIGWHYREMVPAIITDLNEAQAVDLKDAPKYHAQASALARGLDSATPLPAERSPGAAERRFWAHRLFLWHAKRSTDDAWAALAVGPTTKPYSGEAAERFAQAAEKLIMAGNPAMESKERARRTADVTTARAYIKSPEFTLEFAKVKDLTEDRDFTADVRITPGPGRRIGYPLVRIRPVKAPLRVADATLLARLPIADFAEQQAPMHERKLPFGFEKQRTDPVTGTAPIDLLYRGHVYDLSTRVSLMDKPDIEWVYAPPAGRARFAIVGKKDLQQGAVALIVDRTLSMKDPIEVEDAQGNITKGSRKIEEAIRAISEVLEQLPADTMLSIGLFHGTSDGTVKFEWMTTPIRWDETVIQRNEILAKVRAINPPNDAQTTPLARTLVQVIERRDAFPKDFAGFRSIVMLTDGEDNISADAKDITKPGRLVTTALRESDHDIALHMVLFGLGKKEDKYTRDQFAPIEEADNFDKQYRTPGQIWSRLQSRKELVIALRESMLPKVQIVRGVEVGERLPKGLPISLPGERFLRFSPALDAGTYQLRALGSRKLLHLEPGDRALLEMSRADGKTDLRIPFYADVLTHIPGNLRTDSSDGKVHMTLAKNSLIDRGSGNDLQLITTMEKRSQGREQELRIERPWFAWFEVNPRNAADGNRPKTMRIENLKERVAPAWEINLAGWVPAAGKTDARANAALPGIDSWWVDVFPGDRYTVNVTKLQNLDLEFGAHEKNVTVDRSKVHLDDIRVEDNFLYVRATHEEGKPIVVRVLGLKKDEQRLQLGELHRWYDKAGKYTARFGPIERADMGRQVAFQFYTLDSLKKTASHSRLEPEKPQPDSSARDLLPRIKAEE